jgi:glycine cleavage system aminomethyltransferase T
VFEDVGQWKRAWYYPRAGEDMHQAVNRECRTVRDVAGMFDASTLGKIEVVGPDAAQFLNLMYTNGWDKASASGAASTASCCARTASSMMTGSWADSLRIAFM